MRVEIMGCTIDNLTMEETLYRVDDFIKEGGAHQHVVVNVDKIIKAHRDPVVMDIINRADLVNVDGMPVVWASRLLGTPLKCRVTGVDLFFSLVDRAEQKGWRVYFLGAREGVVCEVVRIMTQKHPALRVAGYRNGYWTPEEEQGVAEAIRAVRPELLFVAISSPKKELFLSKYQQEMGVPFAMGVGGTFDVVVGVTKRAPVWMQRIGFEWFYRFLQEPRRMFRRYFIDDMHFFRLLFAELFRR